MRNSQLLITFFGLGPKGLRIVTRYLVLHINQSEKKSVALMLVGGLAIQASTLHCPLELSSDLYS